MKDGRRGAPISRGAGALACGLPGHSLRVNGNRGVRFWTRFACQNDGLKGFIPGLPLRKGFQPGIGWNLTAAAPHDPVLDARCTIARDDLHPKAFVAGLPELRLVTIYRLRLRAFAARLCMHRVKGAAIHVALKVGGNDFPSPCA